MSGGSYDYLCHKETDDLLDREETILEMIEALNGFGGDIGTPAARDTRGILKTIQRFKSDMEKLLTPELQAVWKAVEWMESNDWSLDTCEEEIKKYNELRTDGEASNDDD